MNLLMMIQILKQSQIISAAPRRTLNQVIFLIFPLFKLTIAILDGDTISDRVEDGNTPAGQSFAEPIPSSSSNDRAQNLHFENASLFQEILMILGFYRYILLFNSS